MTDLGIPDARPSDEGSGACDLRYDVRAATAVVRRVVRDVSYGHGAVLDLHLDATVVVEEQAKPVGPVVLVVIPLVVAAGLRLTVTQVDMLSDGLAVAVVSPVEPADDVGDGADLGNPLVERPLIVARNESAAGDFTAPALTFREVE
ncbi:hypothetical protein AB0O28_24060 [Microbispora sp. NPDC088329]|uniref:hypothetical protein n=1 Tax=Microbispora sp. NPDC088329 TaxID=3154869 RepID=UPI003438B53A